MKTQLKCFALAILINCSHAFCSETADVSVKYTLESLTTSISEPVIFSIVIKNGTEQPVTAKLGWQGTQSLKFTVRDPDGQEVSFRPPLHEGIGPPDAIFIGPQREFKESLVLSNWARFDLPGTYEVAVAFSGTIESSHGVIPGLQRSARFSLQVLTRDEKQLRKRCEDLAKTIERAKFYGQVSEAAESLTAVRDPIAVPYLQRVAALWHLAAAATGALADIGDGSAVDALLGLRRSSDIEVSTLAVGALRRVERKTNDEKTKKRIRKALDTEFSDAHDTAR